MHASKTYPVDQASPRALVGRPCDRDPCPAARRGFVDLKLTFLQALAGLQELRFDGLRDQVRGTEAPLDLWLLRAPMFAALSRLEPEFRRRRQLVRWALDSVLHDGDVSPTAAPN